MRWAQELRRPAAPPRRCVGAQTGAFPQGFPHIPPRSAHRPPEFPPRPFLALPGSRPTSRDPSRKTFMVCQNSNPHSAIPLPYRCYICLRPTASFEPVTPKNENPLFLHSHYVAAVSRGRAFFAPLKNDRMPRRFPSSSEIPNGVNPPGARFFLRPPFTAPNRQTKGEQARDNEPAPIFYALLRDIPSGFSRSPR